MTFEKTNCRHDARHLTYVIVILLMLTMSFGKNAYATDMADLVGNWFTEIHQDKIGIVDGKNFTDRKELLVNRADGTKSNINRYYNGSRLVSEIIVTYRWGVNNNVYWCLCQTVLKNGAASSCSTRFEYDVISVTSREFRYKSRLSGISYASQRVPDNFRLP